MVEILPTRSQVGRAEPTAPCSDLFADSLEAKFQRYHRNNPDVFALLLRFTLEAKRRGYRHYGVGAVFERIRWHMDIETHDKEGFKLNNNYRSRYVRLLEQLFPEHAGFYRKRELRS